MKHEAQSGNQFIGECDVFPPGSDELGIDGQIIRPCGNCGEDFKTVLWEYCPWCGQKIEWGGTKG